MSRDPYDPQLEMLDEMRAMRETLDRIALALEGPRPPEPDSIAVQSELWDQARKMALSAAQVLVAAGWRDPEDTDISELHEAIYLRLGGKPSDPERRPS